MGVFKCKMCGGSLEVKEGMTICECPYCETEQTIPTQKDEIMINRFNRANVLRLKSDFDRAYNQYEQIVLECPEDPESYWGLILCKFGIEYVEDPSTGRMIPTLHRTQYASVKDDPDYQFVLEYADARQRTIYESEASQIDQIQKNVLAVVKNESPYDVFISFKQTDESGARTRDSLIANDIYDQLTKEGFKVFYAPVTLEDKSGMFEPYIFAAINSAKVMLVVGTRPEFFDAVWVRNEWSRYLKIMNNEKGKILYPCYMNMKPENLPHELSILQAKDMSRIGFITDIIQCVKTAINGKTEIQNEKSVKEPEHEQAVRSSSINIENILKRGNLALEGGEWREAMRFFNRVLEEDPEEYRAYIGRLCAESKAFSEEDLLTIGKPILDSINYKRACRFGGKDVEKRLSSYAEDHDYYVALGTIFGIKDTDKYVCYKEAETEEEEKEYLDKLRKCKIGDTVRFGRYDWIVVEMHDDVVLLLCKGYVGKAQYTYTHKMGKPDTWEECGLRKWLNERFYHQFSTAEKRMICKTGLYNPDNPESKMKGGNPTEDYIFIMSFQEAGRLPKDWMDANGECWMLRSPGGNADNVALVYYGERISLGGDFVFSDRYIRPAMYLNLSPSAKYAEYKTDELQFAQTKYENDDEEFTARIRSLKTGDTVKFGPCEWVVLYADSSKKELLSKDVVAERQYHSKATDVTWEDCDLRKWLNGEFYDQFSPLEKKMICCVGIDTEENPKYHTSGGNPTDDRIFIMSFKEASGIEREILKCSSDWWLRTPGNSQDCVATSSRYGDEADIGGMRVTITCGVRPAMLLKV